MIYGLEYQDKKKDQRSSLSKRPRDVQATISGQSGFLTSFTVDGTNLLPEVTQDDDFDPMKLIFQRPSKSLKRDGYALAIDAVGLNKDLEHIIKRGERRVYFPSNGTTLEQKADLGWVTVERISESEHGEGVSCEWEMIPVEVDR